MASLTYGGVLGAGKGYTTVSIRRKARGRLSVTAPPVTTIPATSKPAHTLTARGPSAPMGGLLSLALA
jgi:hypothetical protein